MTLFNSIISSDDPQAREKVLDYYRNQSRRFIFRGWDWTSPDEITYHPWGAETRFTQRHNKRVHASALVWGDLRGQGHYTRWLQGLDCPVLAGGECREVLAYLAEHPPPSGHTQVFLLDGGAASFLPSGLPEAYDVGFIQGPRIRASLRAVEEFYGDRRARRSGVPFIYHVWEGLRILQELGADSETLAAWCLHPLLQSDEDLGETLRSHRLREVDPLAVAIAMEYRARANSHLSHMGPAKPSSGSLPQVRLMLIADKVQNLKDFDAVLKDHPEVLNARRLSRYYREWLEALGVYETESLRLASLLPRWK